MTTDTSSTDIQISATDLDPQVALDFVAHPSCGGVVSFVGNVRDATDGRRVVSLAFEAYTSMALKEMQKIADYILAHFPAQCVAVHHRVGELQVGDTAVVIAVSCPHRRAAFAACEYAIDTLKETVPIWKKEVFEDGEVWVAAHP